MSALRVSILGAAMAAKGRLQRSVFAHGNGWSRRIFLLAIDPGEGRFAEPIAATQARRSELVFMPEAVEKRGIRGGRRAAFRMGRPRRR